MWTPRPNAVRFSSVTDSCHVLVGVYADRTGLSPLNSRFSCASRSTLVFRGRAGGITAESFGNVSTKSGEDHGRSASCHFLLSRWPAAQHNVRTQMRLLLTLLLVVACVSAVADFDVAGVDSTVSGQSAYPIASDLGKVGRYPPAAKSGAGYFYDDVLEYRVWLHPERGAESKNGSDDYFVAFAQYENALEFSRRAKGAEQPLVLIRQLKHINEPKPGVFEVIEGERITEWQVPWLDGSKRLPGTIEKFLQDHRK